MYDLYRLAIFNRKLRSPSFVPFHDLGQAFLQRWNVEWSLAADHKRLVVGGDVGRQLSMKPELFLAKGKRRRQAWRPAADRRKPFISRSKLRSEVAREKSSRSS